MAVVGPDVLVIGAGPAGSVAAALLAQRGYQVLVQERQHFPRFSIGESLLAYSTQILQEAGLLAPSDREPLARGYRFLRRLESRLRIVRDRPIDSLPTFGRELVLLARRLGYTGERPGEDLLADYSRHTTGVRAAFLRVLGAA